MKQLPWLVWWPFLRVHGCCATLQGRDVWLGKEGTFRELSKLPLHLAVDAAVHTQYQQRRPAVRLLRTTKLLLAEQGSHSSSSERAAKLPREGAPTRSARALLRRPSHSAQRTMVSSKSWKTLLLSCAVALVCLAGSAFGVPGTAVFVGAGLDSVSAPAVPLGPDFTVEVCSPRTAQIAASQLPV